MSINALFNAINAMRFSSLAQTGAGVDRALAFYDSGMGFPCGSYRLAVEEACQLHTS